VAGRWKRARPSDEEAIEKESRVLAERSAGPEGKSARVHPTELVCLWRGEGARTLALVETERPERRRVTVCPRAEAVTRVPA
jgi:hypothetical protein